jgi:hypothetical protein
MTAEEKATLLARMLVVAYWLGYGKRTDIPTTVGEMMGKGHDGLNWQQFLPLARDILK